MLRRLLRVLLLAAALVALTSAVLGAYARDALVPAKAFGKRAASTLDAPVVREELARELASRLVGAGVPAYLQAPLTQAVAAATRRQGLRAVVRDGAEILHRRLLANPDRPVLLPLHGAEDRVRRVLERRAPALAALPLVGDPVLRVTGARDLGHALNAADRLAALMPAALVAAVALLGLAALSAPGAPSALRGTGLTILLAGAVVLAGTIAGRAAAVAAAPAGVGRPISGAVWDAFLGDLRTWAVALAVAGAAVVLLGLLTARRAGRQYATDAR